MDRRARAKLDPNSRRQLERAERLDKDKETIKELRDLDRRLDELEKARKVQIRLNARYEKLVRDGRKPAPEEVTETNPPSEKKGLLARILAFLSRWL